MTLPFSHDIAHAIHTASASHSEFAARDAAHQAQLQRFIPTLKTAPQAEAKAFFDSANPADGYAQVKKIAADWRAQGCTDLIVIGAGGSGLSAKALSLAFPSAKHRIHSLDNLDPYITEYLLTSLDLTRVCVLMVSKSGSTAETIAHAHIVLELLSKAVGEATLSTRVIAISVATENPMRALAAIYHIPQLEHPLALGGRFSILSAVGMLPAAFLGADIDAICRGARETQAALFANPKMLIDAAALHMALIEQGKAISVLQPYSKRLQGLALWWRQSWAESLGKKGKGSTPVIALGTMDQHSQLQLYLDGPKDKYFTLILTDMVGKGLALPKTCAISCLNQRTLGDVVAAEQQATLESMQRQGCVVRVVVLPQVTEASFGALLMYFALEIMCVAELLGVNAFDQPAVEESKRHAREYLMSGNIKSFAAA